MWLGSSFQVFICTRTPFCFAIDFHRFSSIISISPLSVSIYHYASSLSFLSSYKTRFINFQNYPSSNFQSSKQQLRILNLSYSSPFFPDQPSRTGSALGKIALWHFVNRFRSMHSVKEVFFMVQVPKAMDGLAKLCLHLHVHELSKDPKVSGSVINLVKLTEPCTPLGLFSCFLRMSKGWKN